MDTSLHDIKAEWNFFNCAEGIIKAEPGKWLLIEDKSFYKKKMLFFARINLPGFIKKIIVSKLLETKIFKLGYY